MKSTDRSRLKGYVMKWKQSRVLISAAMYVDVPKAPSLLSLCLQEVKADIVHGIQQLLKSSTSLKKLAGQDPLLWPTVKLVCDRVKEEGEEKVFQGVVLSNYNPITLNSCAAQALVDINQLQKQLQARLEWSDVKMLRAILVFLDTQCWQLSATNDESSDLAEIGKQLNTLLVISGSHWKQKVLQWLAFKMKLKKLFCMPENTFA